VIWRTFWLHLRHPAHFPIYDQHVYRSMAFLLKWPDGRREMPLNKRTKTRTYVEDYRPFFDRFAGCDHRQVDQALWSLGRFLKSRVGGRVMSDWANP
jgi:hypothetical protein